MGKILVLLLVTASFLMSATNNSCSFKFETEKSKVVLPIGYYNNYIKGKRTSSPKYIYSTVSIKGIDSGYTYCIATVEGGKKTCLNNFSELVENSNIKPITLDGKDNTYFMVKNESVSIDVLIPVVNKYVKNDKVELTLLKYNPKGIVDVCNQPSNNLSVAFKKFQVDYSLTQKIVESESSKPALEVGLTIKNPDTTPIIISDIFSGALHKSVSGADNLTLKVSKENMAGFCLSMESDPDDSSLRDGEDYFCRTISLSQSTNKKALKISSNFKNKKFIQLQTCKGKFCQEPHKALGSNVALALKKAGYNLKVQSGKKGSYILVGPFSDKQFPLELKKVKTIVPKAKSF
ncbi:MAG: hypothetical protein OIF32_00870 [Campylobacterales bacterium]|nr:hypothetical protein [Campylobacterales bacterium]